MFGVRRKKKDQPVDWPQLLSLLEDDGRRAALSRRFPKPRHESFLNGLKRIDSELAEGVVALGRQVSQAARLAEFPTLAVAGMLNGGKTSLIASLLSPAGRARALRGESNDQGTHRFVLWLPDSWKADAPLWELLLKDLSDAIGHQAELLSDDPESAHQQYSNQAGEPALLGIPLVATDAALDDLGIGLLDCPDIVSDEIFGVGSPEQRRQLLGKVSTFCSAFLVVSTPGMARDRALGDILETVSDLMPGTERLLAVNKIRPRQNPDDVLSAFEPQCNRYGIKRIFGAYDYEIPKCGPYIPKQVVDGEQLIELPHDEADPLPVFFALSPDPEQNPPAQITRDRLLSQLAKDLDSPASSARFLAGRNQALSRAIWDQAIPLLKQHAQASCEKSQRAQQTLLETTVACFTKRDAQGQITELRLHQSDQVVQQLAVAFTRTAPWYARLSVRMNTMIQGQAKKAGDKIRKFVPTVLAESYAESIKSKFTSQKVGSVVDVTALASSIGRYGGDLTLPHWFPQPTGASLKQHWQLMLEQWLEAFANVDQVQIDSDALDSVAKEMWHQLPSHRKLAAGLTPLAALMATFGSVLMIGVDFGATFIAQASIVELMAAAGLTAFSTYWSGGKAAQQLNNQVAIKQMSIFYLVACHHVGIESGDPLPNIEFKNQTLAFSNPHLELEPLPGQWPQLPVHEYRPEFEKDLRNIIAPSNTQG
ncbi:hypothetical protein SV7mr_12970 [Stieleria bergensis]|uniref:Dynamin family protein n=1 Tax=Stieleria bergensis TaxID=2528025 RepID=A0A517SRQ3_9BACT|nr:hypothetical protein SV7mr_12970 [Planctomycetes bacterium SV_7m_r]